MEFFTKPLEKRAVFKQLCACSIALMCFLSTAVMADGISLEVQRGQSAFMPITSLQSMNVRVGDVMSIRSEYGEIHEFQIQAARRSSLGNRVISGLSGAGARLIMVVTSEGRLEGSI